MTVEIKKRKIGICGYESLAMDENGFRAWGVGDTKQKADKSAFNVLIEERKAKRLLNVR
jgi:hypothetical protein